MFYATLNQSAFSPSFCTVTFVYATATSPLLSVTTACNPTKKGSFLVSVVPPLVSVLSPADSLILSNGLNEVIPYSAYDSGPFVELKPLSLMLKSSWNMIPDEGVTVIYPLIGLAFVSKLIAVD